MLLCLLVFIMLCSIEKMALYLQHQTIDIIVIQLIHVAPVVGRPGLSGEIEPSHLQLEEDRVDNAGLGFLLISFHGRELVWIGAKLQTFREIKKIP